MPTPNHPALPLCSQFAAQQDRYLFICNMDSLLLDQSRDSLQLDATRLKGMLCAYLELELLGNEQFKAMCDELTDFAFGGRA